MKQVIITVCETVIVCIAIFAVWQLILFAVKLVYNHIVRKHIDKKEAEHKASVETTCQDVMERVEKTEAVLRECRSSAQNFPEEHRVRLFAEYDVLEESLRRIRANVATVRKSIGIEVNVNVE